MFISRNFKVGVFSFFFSCSFIFPNLILPDLLANVDTSARLENESQKWQPFQALEDIEAGLSNFCKHPSLKNLIEKTYLGVSDPKAELARRKQNLRTELKLELMQRSQWLEMVLLPYTYFDGGQGIDEPAALGSCIYIEKVKEGTFGRFQKTQDRIRESYFEMAKFQDFFTQNTSAQTGSLLEPLFRSALHSQILKHVFLTNRWKSGEMRRSIRNHSTKMRMDFPGIFPTSTMALKSAHQKREILIHHNPLLRRYTKRILGLPALQMDEALVRLALSEEDGLGFELFKLENYLVNLVRDLFEVRYEEIKLLDTYRLKEAIEQGYFIEELDAPSKVGMVKLSHLQRLEILAWQKVIWHDLPKKIEDVSRQFVSKLAQRPEDFQNTKDMVADTARTWLAELRGRRSNICREDDSHVEFHTRLVAYHLNHSHLGKTDEEGNSETIEDLDVYCNGKWGLNKKTQLESHLMIVSTLSFFTAFLFPVTLPVAAPVSALSSGLHFTLKTARDLDTHKDSSAFFNPSVDTRRQKLFWLGLESAMVPLSMVGLLHYGYELSTFGMAVNAKQQSLKGALKSKGAIDAIGNLGSGKNKIASLAQAKELLKSSPGAFAALEKEYKAGRFLVANGKSLSVHINGLKLINPVERLGNSILQWIIFSSGQVISAIARYDSFKAAGQNPILSSVFWVEVFKGYFGSMAYANFFADGLSNPSKAKDLSFGLHTIKNYLTKLAKTQLQTNSLNYSASQAVYLVNAKQSYARVAQYDLLWAISGNIFTKTSSKHGIDVTMHLCRLANNGAVGEGTCQITAALINMVMNYYYQRLGSGVQANYIYNRENWIDSFLKLTWDDFNGQNAKKKVQCKSEQCNSHELDLEKPVVNLTPHDLYEVQAYLKENLSKDQLHLLNLYLTSRIGLQAHKDHLRELQH